MTDELFTIDGKRKYLTAEEQGRFIEAANASVAFLVSQCAGRVNCRRTFDPVLANSTTELSGYFDSSVVSLFLRRTILLR